MPTVARNAQRERGVGPMHRLVEQLGHVKPAELSQRNLGEMAVPQFGQGYMRCCCLIVDESWGLRMAMAVPYAA
jgi:hypothetical protein